MIAKKKKNDDFPCCREVRGEMTFRPWGFFGATYVIANEEDFARIQTLYALLISLFCILNTFCYLYGSMHSYLWHGHRYEYYLCPFVFLLLFALYFGLSAFWSRRLPVSISCLSPSAAFQKAADAAKPISLWATQALSLLICWLMLWGYPQNHEFTNLFQWWFFLLLGLAGASISGAMLIVKR